MIARMTEEMKALPRSYPDLLRHYRVAADITQAGLAERAHLSVRTISDHERGLKRRPRKDTIRLLADALDLAAAERADLHQAAARSPTPPSETRPIPDPKVQSGPNPLPRHNLPSQATPLIGRQSEQAEVANRLGTTRLLTLTGAGGCGKTRLALEVARDQVDTYPDGVWLTELASLTQEDAVARAVAAIFNLRETRGEPIVATLTAFLRHRHLLLVMDNCEHVIDGVARILADLMRVCPRLCVLTTSRESLAITGEVVWRVPSLATPPPTCPPNQIGDYAAVRLFVARATASHRDFALTERNARVVARICDQLNGMPLAIELAAARVIMLSPDQIAARLDDGLRLLGGAGRTTVRRHQTLRATIDWSYELLAEEERVLFRRLAVFAGGFPLEAAEVVCSDPAAGAGENAIKSSSSGDGLGRIARTDLLDCLTRLVDKSLVQIEPSGPDARFRLLATVREYAQERLITAGEVAALRARHRDWCLVFAKRGDQELRGAAQGEWLQRLEAEVSNLRAALNWCAMEPGEAEDGLRLASDLWWFWFLRDRLTEGQVHLERLLSRPETVSAVVRAGALWRAGFLALWADEHLRSHELSQSALLRCREVGDVVGTAWSLDVLGGLARRRGDVARARTYFEQSVALFRSVGDRWATAAAVADLGALAGNEDDFAAARAHLSEALAIRRSLGDAQGIATTLRSLGYLAHQQEDYRAARPLFEEALQLARDSANTWVLSYCLVGLGDALHQLGDYAAAEELLTEAVTLARATGNRERGASALWSLGLLLRARDRLGEAVTRFRESLVLYLEVGTGNILGTYNIIPALLQSIAGVVAVQVSPTKAVRLFAAADALNAAVSAGRYLERDPSHLRAVARTLADLRAQLGDAPFDAAWTEGQALTLDQMVNDALRDGDSR